MLVSLHVKDVALIEETEMEFGPGLNILTGETGAGKSILIGSVSLALGGKADRDLIRNGAEAGLVELVFRTEDERILQKMKEMELSCEDGEIIISRKIQTGRSISKINGETVTAKQVKELSELLIDIHGQHEHQSLLHKKKHLEILDSFAGKELRDVYTSYGKAFSEWQSLRKEIREKQADEETRNREIDFLRYEIGEIEEAHLTPGEDEELENIYRRLVNGIKIGEAVSQAYRLTGYGDETGAGEMISRALKEIRSVTRYDASLEEYESQLSEVENLLSDLNRGLADYMSGQENGQYDFEKTENRLNLINHLKDKYGDSLEKVLKYMDDSEEKLNQLLDYEKYMGELQEKCLNAEKTIEKLGKKMTEIRKDYAKKMEKKLESALEELNFLSVSFQICITPLEEPGVNGYDDVEFLISTNPGESVKPLGKVASGGELSRIMLAIKTMLTDKDSIDTMIFDEIDAGISGKTAWKVSEKLHELGERQQVICITHLPQIAAQADTHFKIEKSTDGNITTTGVSRLSSEEMIFELARMLGSDTVTDAALKNARELKSMRNG